MALGRHGVLEGKKATIYPGMEDRLTGAEPVSELAVRDGNIITGMAPGAAMEFALTLLEALKGKDIADEVREGACPWLSA
jgi:4-methyl-5(b-hydroxyethyl)-thiazole monophosphate biosynthesis